MSKNGSVKSPDTSTNVSNRIFIMSDSIVKHVRGSNYHVKWKTTNFMLRGFLAAKVMCMEDYVKRH